jgi:phenylpropionate dioxygenase-like ring-hydroxylating dioxygenase large terminal subunit
MNELDTHWKKVPKTGESRYENIQTQPLKNYSVFNNPKILTESWYPVIPIKKLKTKKSYSFKIGAQRFVLYRGEDQIVRALDAFCPHMGADLSRGTVEGSSIRCYFHRWKFDSMGALTEIPCQKKLKQNIKIQTYPVEEKYGFIWVYSAEKAAYPIPHPIGLSEEQVEGQFVLKTKLFVHHHVLMASAIDIQHFASVHGIYADFFLDIQEKQKGVFHWNVTGALNSDNTLRNKWARFILGEKFQYDALFTGGSLVFMTYGRGSRFQGKENGFKLPSFYALWGCLPLENGISEAFIFVLQKKSSGWLGKIKSRIKYYLTLLLLALLKDDDVQAFPRMRFQAKNLIEEDSSVAEFIKLTETLPRSKWSFES